ncbi:MAG: helix-turn-helix domain-containing protein [Caulobacteraceae bacterium]
MSQITPLWSSPELRVYRFHHPVEHEDQPYEEVSDVFRASFVEAGSFDLHVKDRSWRVRRDDVMLSHPDMRFRAGFEGKGFDDVCLSIVYEAAGEDRFDAARSWARSGRHVLPASNRLRYLKWGLRRGVETGAPMLVEYCASEIFRTPDAAAGSALFGERKAAWYAERVHHVRDRLDADYAESLSVSELARSVGMSLFHFTRVFAELTGMPPHRYLLRTRLAAAHAMLREGAGVTDTCYACGFNNLSHFTRSFARRYGAPPSRIAA